MDREESRKRETEFLSYEGDAAALYTQEVRVGGMNWVPFARPAYPLRAQAKLRYTARPADCTVDEAADGVRLTFPEPQRAVTPGQAAVFYDGDSVVGGGTIVEIRKEGGHEL